MAPPLIDSHAHLDGRRFREDCDDVILRAKEAGVEHIIQIGTHPESWDRSVQLANAHSNISTALGLPPHDCSQFSDTLMLQLREVIESNRGVIVGLGEIGLDYHYDMPKDRQAESFQAQLRLAGELDLPVVIHSRVAEDDTIRFLSLEADRRGSKIRGVMHCFPGGPEFADRCMALGLDISFSGIVTFKNAKDVAEAARHVPMDRIHVETDSPYLAPAPHRGKRCEPAYVRQTAEFIATKRGMDIGEFCESSRENTIRLFGLQL